MAENTPTVNLNKAWLQKFLDDDVIPFKDEIRKMGLEDKSPTDGVLVPALADLMAGGKTAVGFRDAQVKPIAIGTMAADAGGRTNGGNITAKLNTLLEQVDRDPHATGGTLRRDRGRPQGNHREDVQDPGRRAWTRSTARSS